MANILGSKPLYHVSGVSSRNMSATGMCGTITVRADCRLSVISVLEAAV